MTPQLLPLVVRELQLPKRLVSVFNHLKYIDTSRKLECWVLCTVALYISTIAVSSKRPEKLQLTQAEQSQRRESRFSSKKESASRSSVDTYCVYSGHE